MSASRAPSPSYVAIPRGEPPCPSLLDFLDARFPQVGRSVWRERLEQGKVTDDAGRALSAASFCQPGGRVRYYREVAEEPHVPFEERLVFQDEHLLVACKPHFLPVTPAGPHVRECLLYRLRERTGNHDLVPVHRLDRETAGLVMFSVRRESRAPYGDLFRLGRIWRQYEAIAALPRDGTRTEWDLASRVVDGGLQCRMEEGVPNARTRIRLMETRGALGRFELEALTGKRHQLRLHMALIGSPIVNDWVYPSLQTTPKTGFDHPLQLLAKRLRFIDPFSRREMNFESDRKLAAWL